MVDESISVEFSRHVHATISNQRLLHPIVFYTSTNPWFMLEGVELWCKAVHTLCTVITVHKVWILTKLTISNNFAVAQNDLHIFPPFGGLDTYPIPSTRHNDKGIGVGWGSHRRPEYLKVLTFFNSQMATCNTWWNWWLLENDCFLQCSTSNLASTVLNCFL